MAIFIKQLLGDKGKEIWTIGPDATIYEALQVMAEKNIGALPVVQDGKLCGIFSERDYARKVILKGKSSKDTKVHELMVSKVFFLKQDRTLDDAMHIMTDKHIRHLPIMDGDTLLGIITIGDVVKAVIHKQANTIRELESYISGGYATY